MEYTAHLVGAPFNDRPRCTHPAMATLARQVNDRISNVARQELITRVPAPTRRRAGASRRGSGGRRSGHQGEPPARAGGRPIGTEDPSGRPITHARRAGAQLVGPAAGRGLHPSADRRRAVIPHPERPRPRAPGPVPARGAGARVVRVRGDRSGGRRERDDARDERIPSRRPNTRPRAPRPTPATPTSIADAARTVAKPLQQAEAVGVVSNAGRRTVAPHRLQCVGTFIINFSGRLGAARRPQLPARSRPQLHAIAGKRPERFGRLVGGVAAGQTVGGR